MNRQQDQSLQLVTGTEVVPAQYHRSGGRVAVRHLFLRPLAGYRPSRFVEIGSPPQGIPVTLKTPWSSCK